MFAFEDTRGSVDIAFTDRHGGFSSGPYSSLNLAGSGGDDQGSLDRNLDAVTLAFTRGAGSAVEDPSPLVVRMSQVHGADVYVVDEDYVVSPEEHQPVVADAVVSSAAGVVLMVRVADCVPVLLADVSRRIVAAVHAGRPGMVAGVVPNTVDAMRALGADRIVAWIGPHVCGNCYEVPEEMRAEVSAVVPESFGRTTWGTPSVDVGAGVSAQLRTAGIEIVDASRCTIEDEDLFSYRRQGQKSGRLAGLVWIRP